MFFPVLPVGHCVLYQVLPQMHHHFQIAFRHLVTVRVLNDVFLRILDYKLFKKLKLDVWRLT